MSKWKEIRNDYLEDNHLYIDAWETDNDNEEGKVIAIINCANYSVKYLDDNARTDKYAQEVISESINNLKELA